MKENYIGKAVLENGKELSVILCPECKCPRFADYKCDTCGKREYEEVLRKLSDLFKNYPNGLTYYEYTNPKMYNNLKEINKLTNEAIEHNGSR